jgi:hypothetical protein
MSLDSLELVSMIVSSKNCNGLASPAGSGPVATREPARCRGRYGLQTTLAELLLFNSLLRSALTFSIC